MSSEALQAERVWMVAAGLCMIAAAPRALLSAAGRDDREEVRRTVRRVFDQMKSHQYDALYDSLSESSRKRISRQRFTSSMQRADDNYQLERIEIGAVRVRGDQATVETVIYGRLSRLSEGEGKIVSRQTLVREGGEWKVSTASPNAGLGSNPRIYLKQDGRWVDVTAAARAARGGRRS